jgi:hypothetical protein
MTHILIFLFFIAIHSSDEKSSTQVTIRNELKQIRKMLYIIHRCSILIFITPNIFKFFF